jgi:hypothetical protein
MASDDNRGTKLRGRKALCNFLQLLVHGDGLRLTRHDRQQIADQKEGHLQKMAGIGFRQELRQVFDNFHFTLRRQGK